MESTCYQDYGPSLSQFDFSVNGSSIKTSSSGHSTHISFSTTSDKVRKSSGKRRCNRSQSATTRAQYSEQKVQLEVVPNARPSKPTYWQPKASYITNQRVEDLNDCKKTVLQNIGMTDFRYNLTMLNGQSEKKYLQSYNSHGQLNINNSSELFNAESSNLKLSESYVGNNSVSAQGLPQCDIACQDVSVEKKSLDQSDEDVTNYRVTDTRKIIVDDKIDVGETKNIMHKPRIVWHGSQSNKALHLSDFEVIDAPKYQYADDEVQKISHDNCSRIILLPKDSIHQDGFLENDVPMNNNQTKISGLTPDMLTMGTKNTVFKDDNNNDRLRKSQKANIPSLHSQNIKTSNQLTPTSTNCYRESNRFVVLRKSLVDYIPGESSDSDGDKNVFSKDVEQKNKIDTEQTNNTSPSIFMEQKVDNAFVCKRKVDDNETLSEEDIDSKKICSTSNDNSCNALIGPVDEKLEIRSLARKSIDSALEIKKLAESFEKKHYRNMTSLEDLSNNEYYSSHVKKSPKMNPCPRPFRFNMDDGESPKFCSSMKRRCSFSPPAARRSSSEYTPETKLYKNPKSSRWSSPRKKHNSYPLSNTPKQPFWANFSSGFSPLMGREDNAVNEEEKMNVKRDMEHSRHSARKSDSTSLYMTDGTPQGTPELSSLSDDKSSINGASLMPARMRFLKNSRMSDFSTPRSNSDYDWKSNFLKTCNSYGVGYLDSHCHIDFLFNRQNFKGSWSKFKLINTDTFPSNFEGCVAVFCNPFTFKPEGLWKDVACEDGVWLAFGCHPKSATDFSFLCELGLRACLQHPKVVALGEIGLDYSGTFKQHMEVQKRVFRKQIQIALDMRKPLVIHCRDAEEDCLEILTEMVPKDYRIHCHCFTGDYFGAERWMKAFPNLFIGLTPMVTYKHCISTHHVARYIPLNKLLLETDSPYFIPRKVPKDEMPLSHPGMAITVAEQVAYFQNLSVAEVLQACRQNMTQMYGI